MISELKKKLKIPGITLLHKIGVKPNHLTITGLILAITALFTKPLTSIILFTASFIIDLMDGNLARRYKLTSKFGGVLDSVSDKIIETLFIYHYFNNAIAVGLSIIISYIKHRSRLKINSLFDRAQRMTYLLIAIILRIDNNLIIFNSLCIIAIIQLMIKTYEKN